MHHYKIIGLITDFGNKGQHYIAAMKSVIKKISETPLIIDIAHNIKPYSIIEGNFILFYSLRDLPFNSIILVVIDPTVGSSRNIIAVKLEDGRIIIGPNNGIFTLISEKYDFEKIYNISNEAYFYYGTNGYTKISSTFHGRDIMAPAAAHLINGIELDELGEKLSLKDLIVINELKEPIIEKDEIHCTIIYIDEFGNLITNIEEKNNKIMPNNQFLINYAKKAKLRRVITFNEIQDDELGLIAGSSGYLEICAKNQSASKILGVGSGSLIKITRCEK